MRGGRIISLDHPKSRLCNSLPFSPIQRLTPTWLAGEEFTAADVMTVSTLSTMRLFIPYELKGYDGILAYLKKVGERPGYQRAMEKGDPEFIPVFGAEAPESLMPQA